MKRKASLLTLSGLARECNKLGIFAPEPTLRNLADRGIITAERDSSNRRLFNTDQVSLAVAYLQKRAAG